jgi:8-oxo-dGTP pyrophosphatase MutT (NUDIX family)
MAKRDIKVKAMGLFVSPDRRFLASSHVDRVKQQPFLRLLDGHVEFGERSDEALLREIHEEIGAEARILSLLDVAENRFVYEGKPGHEIVFVYAAEFADPSFYARETIPVIEPDSENIAIWTPLADLIEGRVFLYPTIDYAAVFARIERACSSPPLPAREQRGFGEL